MVYNFNTIEKMARGMAKYNSFKAEKNDQPKYYSLEMFLHQVSRTWVM